MFANLGEGSDFMDSKYIFCNLSPIEIDDIILIYKDARGSLGIGITSGTGETIHIRRVSVSSLKSV
jgi:hypothetical protein